MRTAAGPLKAVFEFVGCGAFRLGFDGGLGGEVENMSLFAPVVRQVLAQSQELYRRELDRLTALKQRAHNIRPQIGRSNEGGPALFIPRRPLIASMLSCDPERSWFRVAKASLIISTRPALTSASAPFSMTSRFPLPARRSLQSLSHAGVARSRRRGVTVAPDSDDAAPDFQ